MQTLTGVYNGIEITVLYEGEDKPCHVNTRIVKFDLQRLDDTFPSVTKASAFIADELSYLFACQFLHEHDVPKTSRLWDLNHSGYPSEEFLARKPWNDFKE